MNTKESITLMICITVVIVVALVSNAYINSPQEFTIKFEADENIREAMPDINQTTINNYFDDWSYYKNYSTTNKKCCYPGQWRFDCDCIYPLGIYESDIVYKP